MYGEHAIGGLAEDDGAVSAEYTHALVDQAAGWLAGRLDCPITEAFGHLSRLARETGLSVPEAAELLLGDGPGVGLGVGLGGVVPTQPSGPASSTSAAGSAFPGGQTSAENGKAPAPHTPWPRLPVIPRQWPRPRPRRFRAGLAVARGKIERERRESTLRMQQAILPAQERQFQYGQYDISVQYRPAQSGNRVGGDWYEARAGADDGALVTIGDVAGHGLTAAAGMARIGNALRGMTVTGEPPDTLLSWLNDLVCADEIPERVASAAVGVLETGPPRMRWAQAGHPPPVLVRKSEPRLLARPAGVLLGTLPGADYELAIQDLAPGDRVVFYTDGLIERRDRDIDDGLVALLQAAEYCQNATAAAGAEKLAASLSPGGDDDICVLVIAVAD